MPSPTRLPAPPGSSPDPAPDPSPDPSPGPSRVPGPGQTGAGDPVAGLARLRDSVARIEGAGLRPDGPWGLATGAAGLDAALGGGLALGGVTALEPMAALDEAASDALALTLAAVAAGVRGGDVVIVQDPAARAVRGAPHAPGLEQAGIAAHRLLLVAPRRPADVRACVEEAARTPGLAAVVGLLGPQSGFGLVPARRVQLAAEEAWGLVLLGGGLRTAPFAPARARLRVAPCPGTLPGWAAGRGSVGGAVGGAVGETRGAPDLPPPDLPPPGVRAWRIEIIRARSGGRGSFIVETDHDTASAPGQPAAAGPHLRLREPALVADRTAGAPGRQAA